MLGVKKKPVQETGSYIFAWIVIMLISSLMLPIIIVFFVQDAIHHSKAHWMFSIPPSAYFSFMSGMLLITAGMVVYLIIKVKTDKHPVILTSLIVLVMSLPLFYTSLNTYYYFDQSGLHYRALGALKQSDYKWEDFKNVHAIYKSKSNQGSTLDKYEFVLANNKKIVIPVNAAFSENRMRINDALEQYKVPMDNNLGDLYE